MGRGRKKGFILSPESVKKMSKRFKGRHFSPNTEFKKGEKRTKELAKMGAISRMGYKHSKETKIKIGLPQKGEKNHRRKGGITPVRIQIENSLKYAEWRQSVFSGMLHAHHKKSFSILIQEAKEYMALINLYDACMLYIPLWEVSNGITYCEKCHKLEHKTGA